MKRKLISLLLYSLFWMAFFIFARLYFILVHHQEASEFGFRLMSGTFTHGIRLDVSATAYVLAIPFLATFASVWVKGEWYRHFMKIYTWVIILLSLAIVAGDAELYSYWGYRMDHTPLLYLKTPKEAAASVSTGKIIYFFLAVIILTVMFGLIYNRLLDRRFSVSGLVRGRIPASFLMLVLTGSLIIPVRGGFGVAPINAGTVYFNENLFVNHTAVNVVWNVGSSVFHSRPTVNPYMFHEPAKAVALTDSLLVTGGSRLEVLNNRRPNILFIILESFGSSLIGPLGGDPLTTPNFNRLSEEGILFTSFYASGNRTDKAMPAILNGYPAQPAVSIIKEPRKTQSLSSLVSIFDEFGYNTSFWYGGDINFANFKSFVIASGFSEIVTMENFDPDDFNSKWGVHDDVFMKALRDSMASVREPFFRVALTLSSHEPFEVPMNPVFEGNDEMTKFRNSVYYTDKTVGSFIDWAKTTSWWKNTLVILVADHCRRNSPDDLVYSPEIFRIPMLWIGGAVDSAGLKISKTGTQVDISATLLNQLDIRGDFPFARDLLSEGSNSFAFYTFNEGFAFLSDTASVIYDHKAGSVVQSSGRGTGYSEQLGKAFLQRLFDDYLSR
ncbi:MAG: sulfatase-like hydrolase/transferase [Bacteroidales bacterium]|jgi:phosphoglycerol transferase MdoB-like AlkP superfamily enzyme|nr:sulfatase-like hydrolase/transferase [Bacteroidales bacterium]